LDEFDLITVKLWNDRAAALEALGFYSLDDYDDLQVKIMLDFPVRDLTPARLILGRHIIINRTRKF
jgi:hypothetical protein